MKVLNNLTSTITYAVGHTKTFCSRNSSEILLIGGAIGVVTGSGPRKAGKKKKVKIVIVIL